jgi:transcriptional regulator with XRE-family HTH domain
MSTMVASINLPSDADKSRIALDRKKIRELREALGLSQVDAAKRAGFLRSQFWSDIESGRRSGITLKTLDKLAKALNVHPRDLLK